MIWFSGPSVPIWITPHVCPLYLPRPESGAHLLTHCRVASSIKNRLPRADNISWACLWVRVFKQWWGSLPHKHAMKVWKVAVHAVYGTLWTERRSIILNDQSTDEILLWNRSISFLASWAKNCSPCIDYRSNMFLLHVGLILFFWEDLYMLVTVSSFSIKFLLNNKRKRFLLKVWVFEN